MQLNASSLRVLGSLMEKEMSTPDLYPLTVNALIAASNQRSSRDPVTDLSEDEVRTALHHLQDLELAVPARDSGRAARYEHRIRTVLNLRRDETALLCVLLLRGPQTPGELRSRSERMHSFDELASVQATLDRLAARETPLVAALPRMPGSWEVRWMHLLGAARAPAAEPAPTYPAPASLEERVRMLEERLSRLEARSGDRKRPTRRARSGFPRYAGHHAPPCLSLSPQLHAGRVPSESMRRAAQMCSTRPMLKLTHPQTIRVIARFPKMG